MKLAILGGAGMRTVNFVNGLLERTGPPNIEEIALYDIDAQKQEVIRTLACYVAQKKGSAITITAAQDVRSALEGAQVVVAALRVGGDHSRAVDEAIALKHGVIGQETTGVGGFFMACGTTCSKSNDMPLMRPYLILPTPPACLPRHCMTVATGRCWVFAMRPVAYVAAWQMRFTRNGTS